MTFIGRFFLVLTLYLLVLSILSQWDRPNSVATALFFASLIPAAVFVGLGDR